MPSDISVKGEANSKSSTFAILVVVDITLQLPRSVYCRRSIAFLLVV